MKQAKKILAVLITLALIAGIVGSVIYAVQRSSRKKITVYRASELNYGGYGFDAGSTMEGYVTADAAQNVYASGELVVKEILVRRGQAVFVGDTLLTYDTDKTQMNLEKEELSRQQIQLQLDVAMRNLATLEKLKPVSETEEEVEEGYTDEEGWEIIEIDEEDESQPEETPYKDAICYSVLNADSLAYNRGDILVISEEDLDPSETEGMTEEEIAEYIRELTEESELQLGSESNPYRFLCRNGAVIEASFIHHMKQLAEEKNRSIYIQLEVREDDTAEGKLVEAWEMDASRFVKVPRDWYARVIVEDYIATPTPRPTAKPSGTIPPSPTMPASPTPTQEVTGSVTPTTDPSESDESDVPDDSGDMSDVTPTQEPGETGIPDITEPVTGIPDDSSSESADPSGTEPETTQPPAADDSHDAAPSGSENGNNGALSGASWPNRKGGTGLEYATANITTQYLMTAMAVTDSSDVTKNSKADSNQIAAALGLITSDAQMTADEIKEAKKQEQQTIKSLKLDLRESNLKIEAAKKAVDEGVAKAKMNGVVKSVTDPDAAQASGSPIVQVTAAEGLFVRSALPENLYDTVHVGDFVNIMSWTTGQSFSGRIRDISPYPDTSGMFGYGNGTTYYPMTIYISGSGETLSDGEWMQVTVDKSAGDAVDRTTDALYLYKAFIREDSDGKYVLKRGDDGKLVKTYVVTGELSFEGYEILSGVTGDDWLAFPYGRNLSEGLDTREGTIDEFYAS